LDLATAKPESYKKMFAPPYDGSPSIKGGECRVPLVNPPFIQKGYIVLVLRSGASGFVHKLLPVLGDSDVIWKVDDIFIASSGNVELNILSHISRMSFTSRRR